MIFTSKSSINVLSTIQPYSQTMYRNIYPYHNLAFLFVLIFHILYIISCEDLNNYYIVLFSAHFYCTNIEQNKWLFKGSSLLFPSVSFSIDLILGLYNLSKLL
ncbi:hypothetical protein DERF_001675 [Dermatophagoides farinae]|uniref:Uncharacterized protein n=1 Tax=Dermatophagoides farinae TaxID=6954 RepID=A0A922IBA7_DERFA|nr:hypothetical protein DERF_001675 [Dermatophagoides farinae]